MSRRDEFHAGRGSSPTFRPHDENGDSLYRITPGSHTEGETITVPLGGIGQHPHVEHDHLTGGDIEAERVVKKYKLGLRYSGTDYDEEEPREQYTVVPVHHWVYSSTNAKGSIHQEEWKA